MPRLTHAVLCSLLILGAAGAAAEEEWPKVIDFDEGTLTVYQPQADSYAGDLLEGRAAVSWTAAAGGPPHFGAVWLSMRVEVDRDERMLHVRRLEVPLVRFPEASEEDQQRLVRYLERELPGWDLPISLDHLVADLDLLGEAETAGLRHDPPKILFSQEPAVLVQFDGDPKLETMRGPDGGNFERVVNTPFLIVRPDGKGPFYLSGGGDLWYNAFDPLGPWAVAPQVPAAVAKLAEAPEGEETGEEAAGDATPPKILVATEPSELIVSAGPPSWEPVEGVSDLLYMTSTDSDVFLEISTQAYYVVLAGRWYRGRYVDDAWQAEHVPNDELPEAFSDIPEGSATGSVLAHVAGTAQAREAVLDNAVPQTAAVRRDDASLSVEYNGEPRFEPIEDAEAGLQAAVNTEKSVFKYGKRYFACEQGVWYESDSATGPWRVATDVPSEIYSIPASSPHHNVTYVRVYDVTPQVVYVGYTPGYVGSYWYGGCVVWGTGWYYRPWYGPHYYPRPWTWGLNVHYNPWYGWSFGVTFSNGPFRITFGRGGGYYGGYRGGWWGVGGYRPYPRSYPRPGYTRPPRPVPYAAPRAGAARPGQLPAAARPAARPAEGNNLYARPANRDRLAQQPAAAARPRPAVARERPNDVFTDRSGNVYRRGSDGSWQQRQGGQWQPAQGLDRPTRPTAQPTQPTARPSQPSARPSQPAARPSQPSTRSYPSSRPQMGRSSDGATRPGLERSHSGRQRGSARSQGYSRSGGGRRR